MHLDGRIRRNREGKKFK